MFNLYIDNVLAILKQSGLGCHINGTSMGVLRYVDYITLTCPSLYGLNCMLEICNQFAKNKLVNNVNRFHKCSQFIGQFKK